MEVFKKGHFAKIKHDKCLLSLIFQKLYVGYINNNGNQHKNLEVYFYADEVFVEEDQYGNKIYFIPVIPVHASKIEKHPIPIFMLELSFHHKVEVIEYSKRNKIHLIMNDFRKPKVTMNLEVRVESGLEYRRLFDDERIVD